MSETTPTLAPGEHYAGIILSPDGALSHHLILLPGEAGPVTWQAAKDWVAAIGGELPTRQEQAVLFGNLRAQFRNDWYWSVEGFSLRCAWYQYFDDGFQGVVDIYDGLRARAVRRVEIVGETK